MEHRLAEVLSRRDPLGKIAADHRADEVVGGQAGQLARQHEAPVAQDGHALAEREDLLEPVRDEEDGDARLAQRRRDAEQALDLDRRQGGGRLVHHDHPRVERQRLGDLDELLLGDREPARDPIRVERHAEALEDRVAPACSSRRGRCAGRPGAAAAR